MNYLARAHELRERIVTDRRTIHQNGGVSFDVRKSADYIKGRLSEMGIESHEIIDCGIVATIGKGGKTMLLRADYDALPLTEQTGLDFACTNGSCHACGHDFHASMLLGAAQMLKEREAELCGTVKLMFQPSEETIEGARPMIEAGVLENPTVDAAMAIHIVGGTDVSQTGTVRYSRGATYSAVDKLAITVHGKGGHGALPHQTIDPINITSEILAAIRLTLALEVPAPEHVTVTFGQIWGGTANNIIPNEVELRGTVRTYSPAMRQFIKERLVQVAENTARTFRATATVSFDGPNCGPVINDIPMAEQILDYIADVTGKDGVSLINEPACFGSEDFAYVSERVPSVMLALGVGSTAQGYDKSAHNPAALFDEDALPVGAALLANCADRWLKASK